MGAGTCYLNYHDLTGKNSNTYRDPPKAFGHNISRRNSKTEIKRLLAHSIRKTIILGQGFIKNYIVT